MNTIILYKKIIKNTDTNILLFDLKYFIFFIFIYLYIISIHNNVFISFIYFLIIIIKKYRNKIYNLKLLDIYIIKTR